MRRAIDRIRHAGAQIWRPNIETRLSDWVEEHVRLSPEWEASPGRYNLRDNPFWREPLDAFLDPVVRQITVMKSTQVGGTLLLISAMLGLSELDPAPAMVAGPDELYAMEVKERTYANGTESPAVRDRIPPERLRNSRYIDLGTSRVYLAWAGSPQRLRGRACKRVFRSEIDVWPAETPRGGDTLKASSERVKRFIDSCIYDESSPDGEDSRIATLYDAGHKARWMCPCPHCGEHQELRFFPFRDGPRAGCAGVAGYKDENGNLLLADQAAKSCHYVCFNGCRIGQDEKNEMVRRGKWVGEGQSIDREGIVTGEPKSRRHLSYHIWSIHSPTITLADITVAYLSHKQDSRLRDFMQNWLGRRFLTRRQVPEWHKLGKRFEYTHRRGTVPSDVWFLTAGVDVQADGCFYVIRGWGDKGTSWLIETGHLRKYDTDEVDVSAMSPEEQNSYFGSDLRQLSDAVVNRYFLVDGVNPLGKTRLRCRLVGIDSQHRTREVHAFVASSDEKRVRAVRGDHKTKPQDRFRESIVERPQRDGPAYASPRRVINIFTPHYKEALYDKFLSQPGIPGSFYFYHSVVETSADYLRQLINERPTDVIDKATGRKKIQWRPISEQSGNHYWDAEVYSFCMAELLLYQLDTTWDSSTWTRSSKGSSRSMNAMQSVAAVRDEQLM